MNNRKYHIWFNNGDYPPQCERVIALNANDALILAQSQRIRAGLDYILDKIEEVDTVSERGLEHFFTDILDRHNGDTQ